MMTLDQIRAALRDRRLTVVAESTGISYGTLLNMRDKQDANPCLKTMLILDEYLRGDRKP
jgi:hypothetical protein